VSEPHPTAAQRQAISDRAGRCCEYCKSQERFSADPFSVEHVTPKSAGGSGELENLALACQVATTANTTAPTR
jgi:5-methylcytosine-specific restriction endonuclease McrA